MLVKGRDRKKIQRGNRRRSEREEASTSEAWFSVWSSVYLQKDIASIFSFKKGLEHIIEVISKVILEA